MPKPRSRTTALRTDEALWRQIVREVTADNKGGRAGQWSARKAQIAVALYKEAGGGYIGPKSPDNALDKWTRENWRTKSGRPSLETGERYLPEAAIEALTPEEYEATTRAKKKGMRRGQQFVPQPLEIAAKVAPFRRPHTRRRNPMPATLYAKPLGYDKTGFHFASADDFAEKAKDTGLDGYTVEFVDGTPRGMLLFKTVGVGTDAASVRAWFTLLDHAEHDDLLVPRIVAYGVLATPFKTAKQVADAREQVDALQVVAGTISDKVESDFAGGLIDTELLRDLIDPDAVADYLTEAGAQEVTFVPEKLRGDRDTRAEAEETLDEDAVYVVTGEFFDGGYDLGSASDVLDGLTKGLIVEGTLDDYAEEMLDDILDSAPDTLGELVDFDALEEGYTDEWAEFTCGGNPYIVCKGAADEGDDGDDGDEDDGEDDEEDDGDEDADDYEEDGEE